VISSIHFLHVDGHQIAVTDCVQANLITIGSADVVAEVMQRQPRRLWEKQTMQVPPHADRRRENASVNGKNFNQLFSLQKPLSSFLN
jgi:hypothetical protein